VLLCVCRLDPQKGVDVAIRAVRELPDAWLVVLGEGPQRAELEALAGERVYMPGRVPDVAAWLRRADVLVHPVRWEGFGLAVLEAMLAGVPVVASNVSSLPELLGDAGLLVPPDDPGALAAAVARVPADLGERGRARAKAEFSVAQMAERTLAVYESAWR
jgi:glycosyltransferase involved in cell wall biosynthesis